MVGGGICGGAGGDAVIPLDGPMTVYYQFFKDRWMIHVDQWEPLYYNNAVSVWMVPGTVSDG